MVRIALTAELLGVSGGHGSGNVDGSVIRYNRCFSAMNGSNANLCCNADMQAAAALGRARSDFGLWLLPRDRGPIYLRRKGAAEWARWHKQSQSGPCRQPSKPLPVADIATYPPAAQQQFEAEAERRAPEALAEAAEGESEVEGCIDLDEESEVEEVAPPPPPPRVSFVVSDGEDEVQGTASAGGLHELPHLRACCLQHPFVRTHGKRPHQGNAATCSRCYCYICDRPAAECPRWRSEDPKAPSHCNAHSGHKQWRLLQGRAKRQRERGVSA